MGITGRNMPLTRSMKSRLVSERDENPDSLGPKAKKRKIEDLQIKEDQRDSMLMSASSRKKISVSKTGRSTKVRSVLGSNPSVLEEQNTGKKTQHNTVKKIYKCIEMETCRATTRSKTGSHIADFNIGGKVALPEGMLDAILEVHPTGVPKRRAMIFSLKVAKEKNKKQKEKNIEKDIDLEKHDEDKIRNEIICGVRQFTAPNKKIMIPKWMFEKLDIQPLDK